MAGMLGDDVGAVAAVLEHAEAAPGGAHVVFLSEALFAGAAADPGEDDADVADFDAGGVRAKLDDAADDFMAEGERQAEAAILHVHHPAAT